MIILQQVLSYFSRKIYGTSSNHRTNRRVPQDLGNRVHLFKDDRGNFIFTNPNGELRCGKDAGIRTVHMYDETELGCNYSNRVEKCDYKCLDPISFASGSASAGQNTSCEVASFGEYTVVKKDCRS